jgi:hypothetical protein
LERIRRSKRRFHASGRFAPPGGKPASRLAAPALPHLLRWGRFFSALFGLPGLVVDGLWWDGGRPRGMLGSCPTQWRRGPFWRFFWAPLAGLRAAARRALRGHVWLAGFPCVATSAHCMRPRNAPKCHVFQMRRIKTQTVLPSADTAAMMFWALLASGQISMRRVDGWNTLATKPTDQPIDLAA